MYHNTDEIALEKTFIATAVEMPEPSNFLQDCNMLVDDGPLHDSDNEREGEFLRRVKRERESQEREEQLLRFFKKSKQTHDPPYHSPLIETVLRERKHQMALGILPPANDPPVFPATRPYFCETFSPLYDANYSLAEYHLKSAYKWAELKRPEMFRFIFSLLYLQAAESRVLHQSPLWKGNSRDILTIDSKNTVVNIAGRKQNICTVRVPAGVTKIAAKAFYLCNRLEKVILPRTIETIADGAFRWCNSLKCVVIAPGVKKIGEKAFDGNLSLKAIIVPESVAILGTSVFQLCISLTYVRLPKSLKSIPESAFRYCFNLSRVVIPASVTDIGRCSFSHCVSLSQVLLPSGVKSIGDEAFRGCVKISELDLPYSNGQENVIIGSNVFFQCRNVKPVHRPAFSLSFVVWALGQSKNRDNWQTTGIQYMRNILGKITAFAIERKIFHFDPNLWEV